MDSTSKPQKSSLDCNYEYESFYSDSNLEDICSINFNDNPINSKLVDIDSDSIGTLFKENKKRKNDIKLMSKTICDMMATIQGLKSMCENAFFKIKTLENENKCQQNIINDLTNKVNKMPVYESTIHEFKYTPNEFNDSLEQPTQSTQSTQPTCSSSKPEDNSENTYHINFKNIDRDIWFEKKINNNKKIYYLRSNNDESITFTIKCDMMATPNVIIVHNNTKCRIIFDHRCNNYDLAPNKDISIPY